MGVGEDGDLTHPNLGAGDEAFELARNEAQLATKPVLDELHKRLWAEPDS